MKISLPLLSNLSFGTPLKSIILILFLVYSRANLFAQADELIFKDDFSQNTFGTIWQPNSFWSIGDGVAYNAYDHSTLITLRSYSAPSYVIETTVKDFSYAYGRQFHFTFGQADDSTNEAYVVSYFPGASGLLSLGRATDNIFFPETLDQVAIYPGFEATRWQKFKIARYKSGLIQVYVDRGAGYSSLPLLEAIDSTYQQLGHLGWTVATETAPVGFTVDGIEARTPSVEKPAVREKPAEDNLIAQAIATSRKAYNIAKLKVGAKPYTDRNYTVTSLPDYLQEASFVQTAMDDKYQTQVDFLATFIKKEAVMYVAYDPRATQLPDWLNSWERTNDVIKTTDAGTNYLEVYSKEVESWQLFPRPFILGGNLASPAVGAKANYLVAVVEKPAFQVLEAEEAQVVGAKIANNHAGYSGTGFVDFINKKGDYIEWTTQTTLAGTYHLTFEFSNGSTEERSLAVTVDGKDAGIHSFIPITSWDSWASHSAPEVYLTKGEHKIRATAIGTSGPNVDYMSIFYSSSSAGDQFSTNYTKKTPDTPEYSGSASNLSASAYPNPFDNQATITYSLPEKAAVSVILYNQQGQMLKVLVNKIQPAGNYNIEFNGANLPKGLYLYRLNVGAKSISGKILRQ